MKKNSSQSESRRSSASLNEGGRSSIIGTRPTRAASHGEKISSSRVKTPAGVPATSERSESRRSSKSVGGRSPLSIVNSPLSILLPYQRKWVDDAARFKIGLMARQVGKSFGCSAESVRDCMAKHGTMWVVLSAGERQALEFMEKAKLWAKAFEFAIEDYSETRDSAEALIKSAEIRWQNNSRMLALPANPNTARGYSANLILDEFAFHENPDKIWRGIYPSISNPLKGEFKLRIVSTANGKGNKFYDLWTKNQKYSHHLITIHDAVKLGLPLDIEELKEGLDDPEGWAQEYECQFIDDASILLPYDVLALCESEQAIESGPLPVKSENPIYLGVDIGRKHDLTVIWILQRMGDVLWTRGVRVLEKMPFREQLEIIDHLSSIAARVCIDSTGIGMMLAEELTRKQGKHKIEQCQFTAELKNELFTGLRRSFDDKLIRIPVSRTIREDLHGLQKVTSQSGGIRYIAPHNEDGHCDRATALALARRAAAIPAGNTNFMEFWS